MKRRDLLSVAGRLAAVAGFRPFFSGHVEAAERTVPRAMAIDQDIQPFLDTINSRLDALEAGGGGTGIVRNIKDFGAVGGTDPTTGTGTDDTAAVQAAIDSLGPDGGEIFGPDGVFKITSPLTINKRNVIIRGTGKRNIQNPLNVTGLADINVPTTFYVPGGSDFVNLAATADTRGFQCRDFTVTGAGITPNRARYAFDFDKAGDVNFRRDYIFERISVQYFSRAFIFRDTVGGGDKAFGVVRINNSNIMHNHFIARCDDGVQINHFVFTNNEAGQNGFLAGEGGLLVFAHAATIEGNMLEGQRNPVWINGSFLGISVKNNYFEGNVGDFLVYTAGARNLELGPNCDVGVHGALDQTYVVEQCGRLVNSVGTFLHPKKVFMTPEQVLGGYHPSSYPLGLKAGSAKGYGLVTLPDTRFYIKPADTVDELDAHPDSLVPGVFPDPFNPGTSTPGYSAPTAALKRFTWTSGQLSYSAGQWVAVAFMLKRDVAQTAAPYFNFLINGAAGNGSWEGPWDPFYLVYLAQTGTYVFAIGAKAQVDAGATSLAFDISPYGSANTAQSWAWSMSPISVQVVNAPGEILPWVRREHP